MIRVNLDNHDVLLNWLFYLWHLTDWTDKKNYTTYWPTFNDLTVEEILLTWLLRQLLMWLDKILLKLVLEVYRFDCWRNLLTGLLETNGLDFDKTLTYWLDYWESYWFIYRRNFINTSRWNVPIRIRLRTGKKLLLSFLLNLTQNRLTRNDQLTSCGMTDQIDITTKFIIDCIIY